MGTQASNLTSLHVVNDLTASRSITDGQDEFCSALVIPNRLRLSPWLFYRGNNGISFFLGREYSNSCRRIHDVS